jgi:hypothetical protein
MSADPLFHLLRCPTCGAWFGRDVDYEGECDPIQTAASGYPGKPIIGVRRRPYLTCERGHRWTVKQITRSEGIPDRVQLGDFLGEDWA